MSDTRHGPPPRLADDPASELQALLRAASTVEVPAEAQERIWKRVGRPLAEAPGRGAAEVAAAECLRQAALANEPPPEARERIWRRMLEEARARQGLGEPRRLVETGEPGAALLAQAASVEPPLGRRARVYRALPSAPPRRWALVPAGLALAAGLAFAIVHVRPLSSPEAVHPLALKAGADVQVTGMPGRLAPGDEIALASADSARWQLEGVGDAVLSGATAGTSARVTLAESDSAGVRLQLTDGHLALHAAHRPSRSPLVIVADGVEVRIVGTILAIETGASGPRVYVREGRVQVTAPAQEPVLISAGESWPKGTAQADWARDQMGLLAGATLAARGAAPPAKVEAVPASDTAGPSSVRVPILRATPPKVAAASPTSHPQGTPQIGAARPATLASGARFEQSETTVVVTGPAGQPSVQPPLPAPLPRPMHAASLAGPTFDLEVEALRYSGVEADELEGRIAALQQRGRESWRELAVACQALADARGASPGQQRVAMLKLAEVLDDDLGSVQMAIDVRRDTVDRLSGDDRSQARLAILEDLVELGRTTEALKAADECRVECHGDQRLFGQVLRSRLLASAGRLDEARAAARDAEEETGAWAKTAFFFAARADALDAHGQHDRARMAAELSLSLDPFGVQAARLQQRFK